MSTSPKARGPFQEPEPKSPKASNVSLDFEEDLKMRQEKYLAWESQHPGTLMFEIEKLEMRRERLNKKRNWSAKEIAEANLIDARIAECQKILKELYVIQEDIDIDTH